MFRTRVHTFQDEVTVPSIKEVAVRAGVSHATVSRVLTGVTAVSPETAARVHAAIADLGYRPNRMARGLRRGHAAAVGMIVSAISRPFYAELIRALEARLRGHGFVSLIFDTGRSTDAEREALYVLDEMRAIGAFVIGDRARGADGGAFRAAVERGLRVVAFSGAIPDAPVPSVRLDNFAAGHLAARYLLDMGHERIAFLGAGLPDAISTAGYLAGRREGYRAALAEAGLPCDPDLAITATDGGSRDTARAVDRILSLPVPPTAVIASDDELAIEVLGAAMTRGRRVPADLSVVGVDDIPLAARLWPSLTTVRQPLPAMADRLIDLIVAPAGRPAPPPTIEFPPELVVRRSTGPAPRRSAPSPVRQSGKTAGEPRIDTAVALDGSR